MRTCFTAAYSSIMTTPTETVQAFVDVFVSAWPTADAARVAALFTEDASYHNGPLEPVHGRDAIEATLSEFMAMGGEVAVDMLHMLAGDQVVMTERIDHFVIAGKTYSLPVMGVFEIDNGKIRAWRDYFDLAQFSSLFSAFRGNVPGP
jgi:limonene-1,2-epoxide hydrolase